MKTETIQIWEENEYSYEDAFGFVPNITTYIHEDGKKRPGILIVPGGGYFFVSPTEGNPVARRFYEMGYQTFVLTYTVNPLFRVPLKLQPLHDISRAIRYIRQESKRFSVRPDCMAVCGFSAGGHLCASLCVHYEDIHDMREDYEQISNRPDAAILAYPVITSGERAHRDSFRALLGEQASEEELEYMSLEKYVTDKTPPAFLWATVTDETVPVENTLIYAEACRQKNVLHSLYLFSKGKHGLALADEKWAKAEGEERYTVEQSINALRRLKENNASFVPEIEKFLKNGSDEVRMSNGEVLVWPEMADIFLKNFQTR